MKINDFRIAKSDKHSDLVSLTTSDADHLLRGVVDAHHSQIVL